MQDQPHALVMGAVAYDPKVVTIWDGFREFFARCELDFDYVLYSNYERQVAAHLAGHIDVAWNSPLAWLQTQRLATQVGRTARAIAMRDTDRDLTSVIVVRGDAAIESVADLRGKRIGVGARDSPQASLIPLLELATRGLDPERDAEVVAFDVLVGKHGDHIGGERDAAKALIAGEVDAACMIDGNHLAFTREGTLPPGATRVLLQTGAYDHCNFTVLDDAPTVALDRFRAALLGMSYEDPELRALLDLEGLKQWVPGRTEGYALLERAIARSGYVQELLAAMGRRCM